MERYYQKDIECADREQIRAWQSEKLVRQVQHVWNDVPYYREKMKAAGVTPDGTSEAASGTLPPHHATPQITCMPL